MYLDQLDNQSYFIHYRSEAAGNFLVSSGPFASFPSVESLDASYEEFKRPKVMYVAASKPTWRIVMKIDTESLGW